MSNHQDELAERGRLVGDRYRLDAELGRGSMGIVWSATDELLRRPVAVKELRLPPGVPEDEAAEIRERALREARAIAVLTHPNVVTLYDVARQDGKPFVVMELMPAKSLAVLIDRSGPLNNTQLALVADGIAAGLEAAHRSGIVHRDVKPGNVLIGDDERVKITDFGIARNVSEQTITRTGTMLGTPAYIPPEIAEGRGVAAPGDLWSLGATLYAAAHGAPPYDVHDNPLETIARVVHGPVPDTGLSGPIGEVVAGLMVKDPGRRIPLNEVRRRVQRLLPHPGEHAFGALLDPDAPTLRLRQEGTAAANPAPPAQDQRSGNAPAGAVEASEMPAAESPSGRPATAPGSAPAPAPLAADPGAPPFELSAAPPHTSRWHTVALTLSTVVLFALTAAGGFAGTRLAVGATVFPQRATAESDEPTPIGSLLPYSDDAQHTSASSGGQFSLSVPEDWTVFHYEGRGLAANKTISFVSENGEMELAVQRFGEFYAAGHSTSDYLEQLPELSPGDPKKFEMQQDSGEPSSSTHQLRYTTTQTGGTTDARPVRWTTNARMAQHGDDLWIVRVTAPQQHAANGYDLLTSVLPDFRTSQ